MNKNIGKREKASGSGWGTNCSCAVDRLVQVVDFSGILALARSGEADSLAILLAQDLAGQGTPVELEGLDGAPLLGLGLAKAGGCTVPDSETTSFIAL